MLLTGIATGPAVAQQGVEWQGQAVGIATGERFAGAGPGLAWRTTRRLRFGAALSAGATTAGAGARIEGTATFHVSTARPTRLTPYVGGGAAVTADGDGVRERLLVVIGVESRRGGRAGWFLDVGVGGGLRFSAGYRFQPGGS